MKTLTLIATLFFVVSITSLTGAYNYGDIVITEIMQNPDAVSDEMGEWFEIFNTTYHGIDLQGWTVSDNGVDSFVIDRSVVIGAGQRLILGVNDNIWTNGGVEVDYAYGYGPLGMYLGNSDDEIIITDSQSSEIARVEYDGGPNWPDPDGASMSNYNFTLEMNDYTHWFESHILPYGDGDFGTPGEINEPYLEPMIANCPSTVKRGKKLEFDACISQPTPYDLPPVAVWMATEKGSLYQWSGGRIMSFRAGFDECLHIKLRCRPRAPLGPATLSLNIGPYWGEWDEIWYSHRVEIEVID
jgi:hypothetical protein